MRREMRTENLPHNNNITERSIPKSNVVNKVVIPPKTKDHGFLRKRKYKKKRFEESNNRKKWAKKKAYYNKQEFNKKGPKDSKTKVNIKNNKVTQNTKPEPNTSVTILSTAGGRRRFPQKEHTVDNTYDFYYLNPLDISNQLRFISQQFIEENITIEQEVLGKTHQHRDIILLKVTKPATPSNMRLHVEDIYGYTSMAQPEKKIVFIVHGLSTTNFRSVPCLSVSEFFQDLIGFYFDHLSDFDIFVIPMANPDGVAVKKSYWNKNMSPQKTCPGVALDRNFDISWNTRRNMSSCSQQYPGTHPFSEAESRAIRAVLQHHGHRIAAFLHLHAGSSSAKAPKGEAILHPRGYKNQSLDDKYARLKEIVANYNEWFKTGFNVRMSVESLYKWHGRVAGTSVDYASLVHNIPVSLEIIMRPYRHRERKKLIETLTEAWMHAFEAIFEFTKEVVNK